MIKKTDTIFVSIASYRDADCTNTAVSCLKFAKNPENIFIGICQQNMKGDKDFFDEFPTEYNKYKDQIRIIRIPHYEAKGPTFARHLCSTLWNGEQYYLQLDSHIRFVKNWDEISINMIKRIQKETSNEKIVLSYYSKTLDEYGKEHYETTPMITKIFVNDYGMISFNAFEIKQNKQELPSKTGFIGAGFVFGPSKFIFDVPFDPNLPYLFVGEEILFSARLYTNGYDVYSPNENIVFHKYERKGEPKFWNDLKYNSNDASKKVKNILKLSDDSVPESVNLNFDKYGLGTNRTLDEFYKFIGFDSNNKKVINPIKNENEQNNQDIDIQIEKRTIFCNDNLKIYFMIGYIILLLLLIYLIFLM
jgi:[Skp1-protein]-hydroxyproline N-acetylglucosaminyltransferase